MGKFIGWLIVLSVFGCSEAKFKSGSPKGNEDSKNPSSSNENAVDCTDLDEASCHARKEDAGSPDSFRNVMCAGLSAELCKTEIDKAIKQDGKEGSEIRVIGCVEDANNACASLENPNGPNKVVLVDINVDGNGKVLNKTPQFAFLVNDPKCAFCHTRINGDMVSTSAMAGLRDDSVANINGNWYGASTWTAVAAGESNSKQPKINFENGGKLMTNYDGPELPRKADGTVAFPEWSVDQAEKDATGSVKAKDHKGANVTINKVAPSNTVLIGTEANPIVLAGDVLVKGDLVIKGVYKGVGTIYVTGNVYIPANLKAMNSAFPFPDKASEAIAYAQRVLKEGRDGLAIATQKSVFIADLERAEPSSVIDDVSKVRLAETVYTDPNTPEGRRSGPLGLLGVYSWIGGAAEYGKLYEKAYHCVDIPVTVKDNKGGPASGLGSFDIVEAYLYAKNTVAGVARRNSYTINGGIIADHMHIISGSGFCKDKTGTNPASGSDITQSRVNFDYRLKAGLPLLRQIRSYFATKNETK